MTTNRNPLYSLWLGAGISLSSFLFALLIGGLMEYSYMPPPWLIMAATAAEALLVATGTWFIALVGLVIAHRLNQQDRP